MCIHVLRVDVYLVSLPYMYFYQSLKVTDLTAILAWQEIVYMIKDVIITFMGHILQIYVYSVHVLVFMISTNNECNMNKQLFSENYVLTRKLRNIHGEKYNVSHITENSNRKQLKHCLISLHTFALLCSWSTNDTRPL